MRKIILYFALKYNGDYKKIYQAIKDKEVVDIKDIENIESKINCKYITLIDSNYPQCLKTIGTPPFILFYYGDISLLNDANKVAIIGKRKCSDYGKEMAKKITCGLKKYQATIVSGLAFGIDSIAHEESLANDMKTIGVIAGGIDTMLYPFQKQLYENIKKYGLLISEYPNNIQAKPNGFLIRNRIIAALSDHIVVIEANYKSGTMNTVAYGLEFGKEIYAVPNLANVDSGCNYLIKQGARLIEKAEDIFE